MKRSALRVINGQKGRGRPAVQGKQPPPSHAPQDSKRVRCEERELEVILNRSSDLVGACVVFGNPGEPVIISAVRPHSLAEQAGVCPGDVLFSVNDWKAFSSEEELVSRLQIRPCRVLFRSIPKALTNSPPESTESIIERLHSTVDSSNVKVGEAEAVETMASSDELNQVARTSDESGKIAVEPVDPGCASLADEKHLANQRTSNVLCDSNAECASERTIEASNAPANMPELIEGDSEKPTIAGASCSSHTLHVVDKDNSSVEAQSVLPASNVSSTMSEGLYQESGPQYMPKLSEVDDLSDPPKKDATSMVDESLNLLITDGSTLGAPAASINSDESYQNDELHVAGQTSTEDCATEFEEGHLEPTIAQETRDKCDDGNESGPEADSPEKCDNSIPFESLPCTASLVDDTCTTGRALIDDTVPPGDESASTMDGNPKADTEEVSYSSDQMLVTKQQNSNHDSTMIVAPDEGTDAASLPSRTSQYFPPLEAYGYLTGLPTLSDVSPERASHSMHTNSSVEYSSRSSSCRAFRAQTESDITRALGCAYGGSANRSSDAMLELKAKRLCAAFPYVQVFAVLVAEHEVGAVCSAHLVESGILSEGGSSMALLITDLTLIEGSAESNVSTNRKKAKREESIIQALVGCLLRSAADQGCSRIEISTDIPSTGNSSTMKPAMIQRLFLGQGFEIIGVHLVRSMST